MTKLCTLKLLPLALICLYALWSLCTPGGRSTYPCATHEFGSSPSSGVDTFINYAYRNHSDCQISSLGLHAPFSPACETRSDFLRAYTGGGRIGFNAPFMPRGCDMRWYSTEEICEVFGRFERVIVVGDSMMRHVVGALNVLLRKDLGYGAVTNWNFNDQELYRVLEPSIPRH
jgi:hypothetical protein